MERLGCIMHLPVQRLMNVLLRTVFHGKKRARLPRFKPPREARLTNMVKLLINIWARYFFVKTGQGLGNDLY
jgi:hypothetical protein